MPENTNPWRPPDCSICGTPKESTHRPEYCMAIILKRIDDRMERMENSIRHAAEAEANAA